MPLGADLLECIVCIIRAVVCLARHSRHLIRPFRWNLLILSLLSLALYYPVRKYALSYQLGFFQRFILKPSRTSLRLMSWSQTYFLTSMFVKPLRRKWLNAMTEVVAKSELRDDTAQSLQRVPSMKSSSTASQALVYYWYKCRTTSYWTRSLLFVLSTPINYLPLGIGPALYLWLNSGIKARLAAQVYAQTHADWNKVQRVKWIARNWHRLRPLCLVKILVAIVPLLGVLLTMVLDLALMIWMCDEKLHHRLHDTKPEEVYRTVGIAQKINQCETPVPNKSTNTITASDLPTGKASSKTPASRTPRKFSL